MLLNVAQADAGECADSGSTQIVFTSSRLGVRTHTLTGPAGDGRRNTHSGQAGGHGRARKRTERSKIDAHAGLSIPRERRAILQRLAEVFSAGIAAMMAVVAMMRVMAVGLMPVSVVAMVGVVAMMRVVAMAMVLRRWEWEAKGEYGSHN